MNKYPKVRTVGHREIAELFNGTVVIQEKIDGSNFGFGRTIDGKLFAVSRTQDLSFDCPEKLFAPALEYVKSIEDRIPIASFLRCEFLAKPKHNVLAYSRIPLNNLVLFDVERERYPGVWTPSAGRSDIEVLAWQLGIEPVREFWRGSATIGQALGAFELDWSKQESQLGGQLIEGVVIKNYDRFTPGGSILLGKWVREEFKEQHRHVKLSDKTDPVACIGERFSGPARWAKARQRLTEAGILTRSPEDIGPLIGSVRKDIEGECIDEIKDALWAHYKKHVLGAATRGLAEWYLDELNDEFNQRGN